MADCGVGPGSLSPAHGGQTWRVFADHLVVRQVMKKVRTHECLGHIHPGPRSRTGWRGTCREPPAVARDAARMPGAERPAAAPRLCMKPSLSDQCGLRQQALIL